MSEEEQVNLALVELQVALSSDPRPGAFALSPQLFDECVKRGWLAVRDTDGIRFGHFVPSGHPAFTPPGLAD